MATDKIETSSISTQGRERMAGVSVPWQRVEGFIAQLAHDVRNGLNACELQLTFLGEICQEQEAAEEVKRLRTSLSAITKQLQAIRVATAPVTVYPLEYPALDFFEDLHERFDKAHPDHKHRVQWSAELDPAFVLQTDPALSLQACLELLGNALQFEKQPGSAIQCAARAAGSFATFTLVETPGATPVAPERWGWEPLQSTRRGSYGLGLFRVRRILEGQGGSLEIRYDDTVNELVSVLSLPGHS